MSSRSYWDLRSDEHLTHIAFTSLVGETEQCPASNPRSELQIVVALELPGNAMAFLGGAVYLQAELGGVRSISPDPIAIGMHKSGHCLRTAGLGPPLVETTSSVTAPTITEQLSEELIDDKTVL